MTKHIEPVVGLAYLEGRLDAAQAAKLKRHLADCPLCQAQLREHQAVHDLLQAAAQEAVTSPVKIPAWSGSLSRRPPAGRWWSLLRQAGQLSVAGLGLLLIFIFIWQLRPEGPLFEPAAAVSTATVTPTTPPLSFTPSTPITFLDILPTPNVPPATATTGATAVPPTATAEPQPLSPMRVTNIAAVQLNAQGRAAFIADDHLYMESDVTPGAFSVITSRVASPSLGWSADGAELLFFSQATSGEKPVVRHWSAASGQLTLFSELVNRPLPDFTSFQWAPHGRTLLLTTSEKLEADSEWDSGVWLANLETGNLTLIVEAVALEKVEWLAEDAFMMVLDCGPQCSILMAYDTAQNLLWKAYADQPGSEAASDWFKLQPAAQRLLHLNTWRQPPTVDVLDTVDGRITTVFTLTAGAEFAEGAPYLAAAGHIAFFKTVDAAGLVTIHKLGLADGTSESFALPGPQFSLIDGAWNAAGDTFIYSVFDPEIGAGYVYRWQPENETSILIQAAAGEAYFQNFVWAPTGARVFYTLGNQELWEYDLLAEVLRAVASQQ